MLCCLFLLHLICFKHCYSGWVWKFYFKHQTIRSNTYWKFLYLKVLLMEIKLQMSLPPFYLANEMSWQKKSSKTSCVAHLADCMCPYCFFWCLRPSGRNLGTLCSQITISAVRNCKAIYTPIEQNSCTF